MEIIYPVEKSEVFSDLQKGDLFIFKQGSKTPPVYIKTSESSALSLRHANGLNNIPLDQAISKIIATLNIKEIKSRF